MSTGQCPQCEFSGDTRGLKGHIRWRHGSTEPKADADCANCKALESELRMAQNDLVGARSSWRSPDGDAPPAQMPSVAEFVAHCEAGECGHATDWVSHRAQLLKSALDNASDDFLLSQVMSRELMPRISIDVPEVNGR